MSTEIKLNEENFTKVLTKLEKPLLEKLSKRMAKAALEELEEECYYFPDIMDKPHISVWPEGLRLSLGIDDLSYTIPWTTLKEESESILHDEPKEAVIQLKAMLEDILEHVNKVLNDQPT